MGDSVLKGISAALGVTVITLLAGLFWTAMGFGGVSTSTLVDIGLIASCIAAGYVTGKESGQWILGGVSGLGYVLLCVALVALFLELRAWGVIQVLAEGGLIGILAGASGAGSSGRKTRPAGWRNPRVPLWGESYSSRGAYGRGGHGEYYGYSKDQEDRDDHMDDWDDLLQEDRDFSYEEQDFQGNEIYRNDLWEEEQWNSGTKSARQKGSRIDRKIESDKNKWGKKAWWEEDVL